MVDLPEPDRQEHGEALLGARRRGAAQFGDDFREGEPVGNIQTFAQAATQFGAGDAQNGRAFGHFVDREILGLFLHIDHLFEVDHLDADFLLVLGHHFLRGVGVVEILALAVLAGASMIAANDEVGQTVVLADDRVPQSLARATHAHGKVEKRQVRCGLRILVQHRLIAADASEVVNVARLGHADDRMDQKVRLSFLGSAEGQFLVRAVQRVAGLEGDDARPAELAEIGAQFVRRVATALEIIVDGLLDADDRAAQVDRAGLVVQVVDGRMGQVVGAEDAFGFPRLVRHPFVGDRQDGEDDAFLIAERNVLTRLDLGGEVFGYVKVDRHRPERAIGKPHVGDHAIIVGLAHEPFQRVEAAVHQKLEIADLALRQVPRGQVAGFDLQFLGRIGRDIEFRNRGVVLGRHGAHFR